MVLYPLTPAKELASRRSASMASYDSACGEAEVPSGSSSARYVPAARMRQIDRQEQHGTE